MGLIGCPEMCEVITILRCIISQKTIDLIWQFEDSSLGLAQFSSAQSGLVPHMQI